MDTTDAGEEKFIVVKVGQDIVHCRNLSKKDEYVSFPHTFTKYKYIETHKAISDIKIIQDSLKNDKVKKVGPFHYKVYSSSQPKDERHACVKRNIIVEDNASNKLIDLGVSPFSFYNPNTAKFYGNVNSTEYSKLIWTIVGEGINVKAIYYLSSKDNYKEINVIKDGNFGSYADLFQQKKKGDSYEVKCRENPDCSVGDTSEVLLEFASVIQDHDFNFTRKIDRNVYESIIENKESFENKQNINVDVFFNLFFHNVSLSTLDGFEDFAEDFHQREDINHKLSEKKLRTILAMTNKLYDKMFCISKHSGYNIEDVHSVDVFRGIIGYNNHILSLDPLIDKIEEFDTPNLAKNDVYIYRLSDILYHHLSEVFVGSKIKDSVERFREYSWIIESMYKLSSIRKCDYLEDIFKTKLITYYDGILYSLDNILSDGNKYSVGPIARIASVLKHNNNIYEFFIGMDRSVVYNIKGDIRNDCIVRKKALELLVALILEGIEFEKINLPSLIVANLVFDYWSCRIATIGNKDINTSLLTSAEKESGKDVPIYVWHSTLSYTRDPTKVEYFVYKEQIKTLLDEITEIYKKAI